MPPGRSARLSSAGGPHGLEVGVVGIDVDRLALGRADALERGRLEPVVGLAVEDVHLHAQYVGDQTERPESSYIGDVSASVSKSPQLMDAATSSS